MSLALVCVGVVGETRAGVVIGGTRVVFPGASRDIAVRIENKGQEPALVQAWIDDGDARSTPENARAPFAITPPVFRIDPGRGHALRIVHVGGHPPSDREVLYWLNVLEIPRVRKKRWRPIRCNSPSGTGSSCCTGRLVFPSRLLAHRTG